MIRHQRTGSEQRERPEHRRQRIAAGLTGYGVMNEVSSDSSDDDAVGVDLFA